MSSNSSKISISDIIPLYIVIFIGFVGFSLFVTVFTPVILAPHSGFLPSLSQNAKTVWLGLLLCTYPLGQFFGSPIMGALSDQFGRKPVLLISLIVTTLSYVVIALGLNTEKIALLMIGCLIAGFAEANIVTAQSAIADITTNATQHRTRLFGYI